MVTMATQSHQQQTFLSYHPCGSAVTVQLTIVALILMAKATFLCKMWYFHHASFHLFTPLSARLRVNVPRVYAGRSALCYGRCWQERCPTRMWTPPLSSGEWAITACSCLCLIAVQRASNCSWGNAGEQTGGEEEGEEKGGMNIWRYGKIGKMDWGI